MWGCSVIPGPFHSQWESLEQSCKTVRNRGNILTHVSASSGIFQKHVTYLCAIFILDADHEISKNHQCISKWIIDKSTEHQVCRFGRLSDSLKESKKWETSAEYPVNPTTAAHWRPRRVRNFKIQVSEISVAFNVMRIGHSFCAPSQKKDLNWEGFSTQQHRDLQIWVSRCFPSKKRPKLQRCASLKTGGSVVGGLAICGFVLFSWGQAWC